MHFDTLKQALVKSGLANGTSGTRENGDGVGSGMPAYFFTTQKGREMAKAGRAKLDAGQLVFVSGESLDKLEKTLGERPSKMFLRSLIEDIANGKLKVVEPNSNVNGNGHTTRTRTMTTVTETGYYTLQQAAKALGCKSHALYVRAINGRIRTFRQGSRWLLDEQELSRLKQYGI